MRHGAKDVSELWKQVNIEWNKLDANTCRRYIDSMPNRIEAVIRAMGGYTRYWTNYDLLNHYIYHYQEQLDLFIKVTIFQDVNY